MEEHEYLTVARSVQVKIPVGACRFISSVAPCISIEGAREFIYKMREKFNDATHNTYAYRLGTGDNELAYYNDDREPAGTAGLPMLKSIKRLRVTDVVVVGTRYFGGIKLGIGGLIRAYRLCAEEGLKAAGVIKKIKKKELNICVSYKNLGDILKTLNTRDGELQSINYDKEVLIKCLISLRNFEIFIQDVKNITRGKAIINGLPEGDHIL